MTKSYLLYIIKNLCFYLYSNHENYVVSIFWYRHLLGLQLAADTQLCKDIKRRGNFYSPPLLPGE